MFRPKQNIMFRRKELSGSRLRCLMFTSGSKARVAQRLTLLVNRDDVKVTTDDIIMPRGFLFPDEARLVHPNGLLSAERRGQVKNWWLKVPRGANTPNWDIAATATVGGLKGLVLIEAKAHASELKTGGMQVAPQANQQNRDRIGEAISEANSGLGGVVAGWNLSRDSHYQLSNRFAWSWKIASLGVPVVLVYLGFLNADEMAIPFRSAADWADCVRTSSCGRVPAGVWGTEVLRDGGTPFAPLIRAVDLLFEPSMP
jgi:hypothetical protein